MSIRMLRRNALLIFVAFWLAALPAACPASAQTKADRWAVLIGVDKYKSADDASHAPTLVGAAADAKALAKTLIDVAGYDPTHVVVLTTDAGDTEPRRNTILREIDALKTRVKSGDSLFVFFSGHGCEDEGGASYVLPSDSEFGTVTLLKSTALPLELFTESLHQLPLKLLVIAMDMCRVDISKSAASLATNTMQNARGLDFRRVSSPNPTTLGASGGSGPEVAVKLWSCSPDEKSYEMRAGRRGYFSYYLEQALRGKATRPGAAITLTDIARYVPDTVQREVARVEGELQHPRLLIDGATGIDALTQFVLVPASTVAAVPEPAPAESPNRNIHAQMPILSNVTHAKIVVDGAPLPPSSEYLEDLPDRPKKIVRVKATAPGYVDLVKDVTITGGLLPTLYMRLTLQNEVNTVLPQPGRGMGSVFRQLLPDVADDYRKLLQDISAGQQSAASAAPSKNRASILATVARAQAGAGDIPAALLSCQQAVTAAQSTAVAAARSSALADTVKAKIAAGDVAEAAKLAQDIADLGARAMALSGLARAQADWNDPAGAHSTIALALEAASAIHEESEKAIFLGAIVRAQTAADDRETAQQAQSLAASAAQSSGTIYGLKVRDLLAVAQAQILQGDIESARASIASAFDALQNIDSVRSTIHAYTLIANEQAISGDRPAAQKTIEYALTSALGTGDGAEPGEKADELIAIAASQTVIGDRAGASQTLQLAETETTGSVYGPEMVRTLANVAWDQVTAGADPEAARTLDAMIKRSRVIRSGADKAEALGAIAMVQLAMHDTGAARTSLQAAIQVARSLPSPQEKAEALARVADQMAKRTPPPSLLTTPPPAAAAGGTPTPTATAAP